MASKHRDKRSTPPPATPAVVPVAESGEPAEHVEAGWTIGQPTRLGITVARWEERLAVFLVVFGLMVFLTKLYGTPSNPGSWNDQSRFATIQALVEQGTFAIDNTSLGYWTGDKVFAGSHFYSTKPPLLSLAGAAVYWPLHHWFGWTYFDETQAPTIYYLVTLALIGLPFAGAAVLFYNTLNEFGLNLRWRIIGVLSLVLGSLYLPYSLIFQNHTVAGIAGLYSFVLLLRTSRNIGPAGRNLVLAGLMITVALATDLVGGAPFAIAGFAWLVARVRQGQGLGDVAPLLGGFLVPLLAHFVANYAMLGSWRPIYMDAKVYKLTSVPGLFGEVLERKGYFATLFDPYRWRYIINNLFGIRGIFLYTPTLLFGCWIGWKLIGKQWSHLFELTPDQETPLRWWTAGFLAMTLVSFVYLLLRTENYGGTSYGARYYLAPMSVLLLFAALVYTPLGSPKARGWYAEALRLSVAFAFFGIAYPWGVALIYGAPTNFSFAANAQALSQNLMTILLTNAGYMN